MKEYAQRLGDQIVMMGPVDEKGNWFGIPVDKMTQETRTASGIYEVEYVDQHPTNQETAPDGRTIEWMTDKVRITHKWKPKTDDEINDIIARCRSDRDWETYSTS